MISVVIRTKDEAVNLPHCLAALVWCEDIVVVDAGSVDETQAIARKANVRIFEASFQDESEQLNWIAQKIEFKNPWVYICDADEIVSAELRDELLRISNDSSNHLVAYRVRYKNYFMNRWIRHCGIYPVWLLRVFRPGFVNWERKINTTVRILGDEGKLDSHFMHYSFRKGLTAWFEKHNRYSTLEAVESTKTLQESTIRWSDIFQTKEPARRRIALKELSFRMPCRPLLRFIYMYFLRFGFLDGAAGFHYCKLLSVYEYMIVMKQKEAAANSNRSHPLVEHERPNAVDSK